MKRKKLVILCLLVFVAMWGASIALWYAVHFVANFYGFAPAPLSWRAAAFDSWPYAFVEAVSIPFLLKLSQRRKKEQQLDQGLERKSVGLKSYAMGRRRRISAFAEKEKTRSFRSLSAKADSRRFRPIA